VHAFERSAKTTMRQLAILIALFHICMIGQGAAGISAPVPFARISADETRIFVMRDGPGWSKRQVTYPKLSTGKLVDFLLDFPSSGVYTLGDRKLVYPIDWFSLDHEVIVSPDLAYVARLNRFDGSWALKFYADGLEVRSYTCDDLLTALSSKRFRPYATWDWHHPWHEDFNLQGRQVRLTTVDREFCGVPLRFHELYLFNIETGVIEDAYYFNKRLIAIVIVATVGALTAGVAIVLMARMRRSSQQRQNKAVDATAVSPPVDSESTPPPPLTFGPKTMPEEGWGRRR
jgi:hypothetical protein